MTENTEALPPLPKLPPLTCGPETGHAAIHTPEQIHAYAIAYARAALAQQAATPTDAPIYWSTTTRQWETAKPLAAAQQAATPIDPAMPVKAWLVTGGRSYVDRSFVNKGQAESSIADRKDGARLEDLVRKADADAAIAAARQAAKEQP